MAAPRLSDAQKQELVSRFQSGAGTQELAAAYGCSPNTVIRVVKAAIEPSQYEDLKRQRGRRTVQPADVSAPEPDGLSTEDGLSPEPAATPEPAAQPSFIREPIATASREEAEAGDAHADVTRSDSQAEEHEAARSLAIDDADDFDAFEADDQDEEEGEDPDDAGFPEQTFVEVPISLAESLDQPLTTARPWRADELPDSAYMLVDKTVELQARPLAEIPELGRLEAAEQELQALVLYSNPRQAKRHCGRSQRVIKVPDLGVLERTAPYLLRQGICRIVVEGALYALPEA